MASFIVEVDPSGLHVPPARLSGADPYKLNRQMALFGGSTTNMPEPWAYRRTDGELMLYNGVTRATRIARLSPGVVIRVLVVGAIRKSVGSLPTVGEFLP